MFAEANVVVCEIISAGRETRQLNEGHNCILHPTETLRDDVHFQYIVYD